MPETPAPDAVSEQSTLNQAAPSLPGSFGRYKLLQRVGEGGMGEVWHAEQTDPVRRQVAIKVIKAGMDSAQVVARFEAERQALALMDHPTIATVFDGGTTPQGRPYFAMEYVRGEPITTYCDRHRLGTRERLDLFAQVCEGVQHAHQKGVIHRDLKPSNILVTIVDDRPVPKIIDFGVAKATAQHLTERSLFTELGVLIGTPEYMSPEQAEMGVLDIDTRTDVYALGMLLYELLTGALPFDRRDLRQAGLAEIQRIIREREPARPSTRITQLGPASTEAATNRRSEPRRLASELRGDLDWITMKALEKDRTRRYGSASELATDVRRHLDHQPVLAGPPSALYRARKFVRRHRLGVGAAATLVVLLVAFGVAMALQAGRIARERDRANREAARANEEAAAAQQVSDFLVGLFEDSDPSRARGDRITVREVLDRGSAKIDRDLVEQPAVRGRMLLTMGRVYRNLGLYDTSSRLLEDSLETARRSPGPENRDVATAALELAWLYRAQGKADEAVSLGREALAIRERAFGPDDPRTAFALTMLGTLARDRGEYPEAEKLLKRSLEVREKALGPDHVDVASSLYQLGWLKKITGQLEEAKRCYERALPIYEKNLGPDHPYVAWCLNDLSVVLENLGDREGARRLLQRSLDIKLKVLGPDHPDVAAALNNLGVLLWRMRDFGGARAAYERALAIREKTLGPGHADVAGTLDNLGLLYQDMGEYAQAQRYYERSLRIMEGIAGSDRTAVASTCVNLAELLEKTGQLAQARSSYERALAIYETALGPEHGEVAAVLHSLAGLYARQGEYSEAERLYRRALAIREKTEKAPSPALADTLSAYAALLRKTGRPGQAEELEAQAKAARAGAAPRS
jgi:eukaryotic-like serine/threonine-protein kinase